MGRSTFNWWRRNKKRKTLPKYHPLLSRIRNGDFDTSQYLQEAQTELDTYNEIVDRCTKEGKELDLRIDTINQRIFDEGDQYMRRYNRLMKDFYEDEDRILLELRKVIQKNYHKSFDYIYDRWLKGKEPDMTIEEFYERCEEMKKCGRRAATKPRSRKRRRKSLPEIIYGMPNE